MDRAGGALRVLTAAAAGLLIGAAAPSALEALVWIAPGHEQAALARQPATCLATQDDAVTAGRALFYAPNLLGGQASRAGVSCASCHSNGRNNPHFFLAGVSDKPGTADVSQSFFSPLRGNGRFDPKPIPDLAAPGKVSRDPASGALERFMRGLIVEEFSGAEPSPAMLSALGAYVRAIRACPDRADEPRTLDRQLELVRASAQSAAWFADNGDPRAAKLLAGATRRQLGLIDERLAPGGNKPARRALLKASRELERGTADPAALEAWLAGFDKRVGPVVERAEPRSLYSSRLLMRWVSRSSLGRGGGSAKR